MSWWTDMFVAPRQARLLEVNEFRALITELIDQRVVIASWALLTGAVRHQSPLAIDNDITDVVGSEGRLHMLQPGITTRRDMTVVAAGQDARAFREAFAVAPYGQVDIAVQFAGLDFGNELIAGEYDSNPYVTVYALIDPMQLTYDGDEEPHSEQHPVQCYFRSAAKHGPEQAMGLLWDVLARYFGADMVEGCSYS
jgi:hypothetical protein